jgi:hypothetical protein
MSVKFEGNVMHIRFGYDVEILVPATAKALEAYNTLFNEGTVYVADRYTDDGYGFQPTDPMASERLRVQLLPGSEVRKRFANWEKQQEKEKAKALAAENTALEDELNQPAVIDNGSGQF